MARGDHRRSGGGGLRGLSSTSTPALDVATFAERYCALFAPCCTDVGVTQGGMCAMTIGNNARLVGKVGALRARPASPS